MLLSRFSLSQQLNVNKLRWIYQLNMSNFQNPPTIMKPSLVPWVTRDRDFFFFCYPDQINVNPNQPINKSNWSLHTNYIFSCRSESSNISQLFQFSLTANQRSNQISGLRFRIFPKQRTRQRSWFKFNPNQS